MDVQQSQQQQQQLWGERESSKKGKVSKAYSGIGVVVVKPQESISKAGKVMLQFVFQETKGGELRKVIALKMLEETRKLQIGMKLSLTGTIADDGEGVFLNFFTSSEIQVRKPLDPETIKKNSEEIEKYYATFNMVRTWRKEASGQWITYFIHKDDGVELRPGIFQQKIEFIMDVLGPAKVTELLRNKLKEMRCGLTMGKEQSREIKKFIHEIVDQHFFQF